VSRDPIRAIGAIHLALSGVVNTVVGVGLWLAFATPRRETTVQRAIEWLQAALGSTDALAAGGALRTVVQYSPVLAVLGVTLGIAQFWGGRFAWRGRRRSFTLAVAACGLANPVTAPLSAIALVSLLLVEDPAIRPPTSLLQRQRP
jgi:MFS family permease